LHTKVHDAKQPNPQQFKPNSIQKYILAIEFKEKTKQGRQRLVEVQTPSRKKKAAHIRKVRSNPDAPRKIKYPSISFAAAKESDQRRISQLSRRQVKT